MKTQCPLGESWHHKFCSLYPIYKKIDSFDLCMNQTACKHFRKAIVFNETLYKKFSDNLRKHLVAHNDDYGKDNSFQKLDTAL
jgi:hypothetical protein